MNPLTCDAVRDLLPAFALGALERDEEAAVRAHLETCRLHPEAGELGAVAAQLALVPEPVEPPAGLKGRILAAAAADREARGAGASAVAPAPVPLPAPRGVVRPRFGFSRATVLQLAAVIVVIVLGAWNLDLQARLDGLESDVAAAQAYEHAIGDVLAVAVLPGSQTAVLGPGEGSTSTGLAAVGADGSIVLAMRGLAPTAGTEVYEAWVIVGDAAPVPVGGFPVGTAGTASFRTAATPAVAGAVLALTHEPGPGATTPTLPIIAIGTATAPPA